ncbi:GNAT family N-acetyltransferase [Patescibacteria group bacterium]|nr:GNAT family N-acetyltransferase [Patescibacteria group bacterium]
MDQNGLQINIIKSSDLTKKQKQDKSELQKLCFPEIDPQEIQEDFYHPEIAHAFGYIGRRLVGWAGIHIETTKYEGKKIKLGGFGICTHPNYRKKGIASKLSSRVINFLKQSDCDLAFLSIDPKNIASKKLHQKTGFVSLKKQFSWINSQGEMKEGDGGMIASLGSAKIFNHVLNGKKPFYISKGYW